MIQCYYCGWPNPWDMEKDHVIPESRGGPTSDWNLVWACRWCNQQKGDKTGAEYVAWRTAYPYLATYGPRFGYQFMIPRMPYPLFR
jgi:5-methylcytosine-specific restriction endonuclease McrA